MGLADGLGSGIRNMYKYNEIYSKSVPRFVEGEIFKTIISISPELTKLESTNYKLMFINYIKENQSISRNEAMEISGLQKSQVVKIFKELLEEGRIVRTGNGPKTQYSLK